MSAVARFERAAGDTHCVIYGVPDTGELWETYFTSYEAATAYRDEVAAMGANPARVEALSVTDAIDAGNPLTIVTFTTMDGDTATVEQPGDTLTAVTAVIAAYQHLAYCLSGPWGSYTVFRTVNYWDGEDGVRYRVDKFGRIESATPVTSDDVEKVNANGLTFMQFMAATDRAIEAATGVTSSDLPDAGSYWDSWRDGMTPEAMARTAIRYA